MLPLHRYSLCLLLLATVYAHTKGKHPHPHGAKEKRDIDDLRDDPLLLSIFKSDVQEKRKDRSISAEQETKQDTAKESTPHTETTDSARVARDLMNGSMPIPTNLFANFADTPIVGGQVPLGAGAEAAVVPQLFQANYMPMEGLEMANPGFQVPSETVASVEDALQKKSLIPEVPYLMNIPAVNPSTMYSNDIIKKDDIPEATLPGSEGALDEAILKADEALKGTTEALNTPLSALTAANAVPAAPAAPAAAVPAPGAGAVAGEQKSTVDAPQVQNLDGTITRPLIKEDDLCADQYASCNDFAKAEYCTKYSDLMKIQCRKSCGYCVPGQRDVIEEAQKPKNSTETKSTVDADAPVDAKPDAKADAKAADVKSETKTDAKADAKAAKAPDSTKNETEGTKKSTTPAAKPLTVISKKSEIPKPAKSNSTTASKKSTEEKEKKSDAKEEKKVAETKKSDVKEEKKETKKSDVKEEKKVAETKEESKKSETPATEEKGKKKDEAEQKSKIAEAESGSTNEGDVSEAESGDFGSGENSGSGSGSGEEAEPTVLKKDIIVEKSKKSTVNAAATKATITKAKEDKKEKKEEKKKETKSKVAKVTKKKDVKKVEQKNKITTANKPAKSNLGEFTLPVIKSEVSTASLALNDKAAEDSEESGSGSGSGDDEAEEKILPAKKTAVVEKPKAKAKVPEKKKEVKEVKKSEKPKPKESKVKAAKKSKKPEKPAKKNKVPVKEAKALKVVSKKSIVPRRPKKNQPYPKIDLRLIASALAHYEEAALELAGEYPKQAGTKEQEVSRSSIPKPQVPATPAVAEAPVAPAAPATPEAAPAEKVEKDSRSFIPRAPSMQGFGAMVSAQPYFAPEPVESKKEVIIDPLEKYRQNLQIAKILTDDRNGRSIIPKYLRLTKDVHMSDEEEAKLERQKADSLTAVQKRFNILGVEPTLIDYYAETGKINPFAKKKKKDLNVKKSAINANSDPYEYLRNMPAGASMLPIDDPKARSKVPSDHSYPVFLMKVSPGERKYIEEAPRRRGEIRHLNAEGVEVDEMSETSGIPKDIVSQMEKTAPKLEALPARKTQLPQNPFGLPSAAPQNMLNMMLTANNLRNSLLQAQGSLPQAKATVPAAPKRVAPKTQVPKPAAAAPGELTEAAAKAMERSAMSIGMQYAESQMKALHAQQKNARARLPFPRGPPAINRPAQQRNRILPPVNFRPQPMFVKPGTGIAAATSPLMNPELALEPQASLSESS